MKIRIGFVSNSSSTSFTITNISEEHKTIVDFVKETPHLIEEYKKRYVDPEFLKDYTQEDLIKSAQDILNEAKNVKEENPYEWEPGETHDVSFGDEQGTFIGKIYDYILRGDGVFNKFLLDSKNMTNKGRAVIFAMMENSEDFYVGVDSHSFRVRFGYWQR